MGSLSRVTSKVFSFISFANCLLSTHIKPPTRNHKEMVNIQNCLKLQTNLIKHCVWNSIQHFKYYLFDTSIWYTGEMPARPCSSLDPLCPPLHPCPSHCGRIKKHWIFLAFICLLHPVILIFCYTCLWFVTLVTHVFFALLSIPVLLIAVEKQARKLQATIVRNSAHWLTHWLTDILMGCIKIFLFVFCV